MSLYVPAMQSNDRSNMIYNATRQGGIVNSFLDGVRMAEQFRQSRQRMKNENERLQLQKDQFAFDKDTTAKNLRMQQQRLDLAKAGNTRVQTEFDQVQEKKEQNKKLTEGIVDNLKLKMQDDARVRDEAFKNYDNHDKRRWIFFNEDIDGDDGFEFIQRGTGTDATRAEMKKDGLLPPRTLDPSLMDYVKDFDQLNRFGTMIQGDQDGGGGQLLKLFPDY